jgi:cobalt/nickel transport system permease protein
MHVPDGFLDAPTSAVTGVVALAAVGQALRGSRTELEDRVVPLAGMTSAFVFAAQMINFPIGLGTSGHLMGGAIAAVLVGPQTAVLCMSTVLLVQALLFADGGLTALGTNITLMGVTTVVVGWLVTRAALAVLPRRPASVVPAAAAGAFVSVVAAAVLFVVLYAVGGQADVPLGPLAVSMVAWHSLIGVGEAVLTAATVSAVLAVRPDLVHAARGTLPPLVLVDADGHRVPGARSSVPAGPPREDGRRTRPSVRALLVVGGLVTTLVAGVGSSFASSSPDGLQHVAQERGFLDTAREHLLAASPLADGAVPVGVAGLLGVAVTLVVAAALIGLARRRRPRAPGAEQARGGSTDG